jgi:hypothetical protein
MNNANSHDTQPRKRRWKLWLSLAFLGVFLVGAGISLLTPPLDPRPYWPPLSAAEARQALVEFAASDDPDLAKFPIPMGPIPELAEEPDPKWKPRVVVIGKCRCDLDDKSFKFPPPRDGPLSGSGLLGRFVYENGVWKAKLGGPPDGRFKNWAG